MRRLTLVAVLVCACTSLGNAQTDSETDSGSKIIAMEHVWAQAYMAKDSKALDRMLDDAFICVASDGKLLSKAEILADVKISTALQILTDDMVVHLHGDTAIVSGTFRTKGVERGKPFTRRERFVDTWLFKNGQWLPLTSLVAVAGN